MKIKSALTIGILALPTAGFVMADTSNSQINAQDSQVATGNVIPEGKLMSFVFDKSVIYPGTTRKITVFVPAQYNSNEPACVLVRQDGYHPRTKEVMEQLIAESQMPVTVGVFIQPGVLRATTKDARDRSNRCLEYDGVGDSYARLVLEEVLPEVVRRYSLNLSTNGNDRCIMGGSSGGMAAFNAAWERPDAFTRVSAVSGSFVAFRGGQ